MVQNDVKGPLGKEHGNAAQGKIDGTLCSIHPNPHGPYGTIPRQQYDQVEGYLHGRGEYVHSP